MKRLPLASAVLLVLFCLVSAVSYGSSHAYLLTKSVHTEGNDPTTNVPFPSAGDAYCSFTNGCGTIPGGGQTAYQWTAGDFVQSPIFTNIPTNSVTDLTASWIFQDLLGNGADELWFVYLNNVLVASADLTDCNFCGTYFTVTGTVNFGGVAPLNGGYQLTLVLQNTVAGGDGSVAWADGGITGLSYGSTTPEPGTLLLFGSGLAGLAGLVRRKLC